MIFEIVRQSEDDVVAGRGLDGARDRRPLLDRLPDHGPPHQILLQQQENERDEDRSRAKARTNFDRSPNRTPVSFRSTAAIRTAGV